MTAFNVVRFRVKPGREEEFIEAHRTIKPDFPGWRGGAVIKTGERSYCVIGEWDSFASLVEARPKMIAILDGFRDALEDLGGDLGVTDPVSGEVVVELPGSRWEIPKPRARPRAAARRGTAAPSRRAKARVRAKAGAKPGTRAKMGMRAKAGTKAKSRKPSRRTAGTKTARRGRR